MEWRDGSSRGSIRIAVINGSVRPGNYTKMAAALAIDELRKHPKVSTEIFDPAAFDLPWPGIDPSSNATTHLQQTVKQAAGIILATPEYHGSFSSVMKLIIENLGFPSALAGKPVALLGVAGGTIGAIKSLEHLRSVVSHVGGIVLPLPISVPNVRSVFDHEGRCLNPDVEQLIRSVGTNLVQYLEQNVCPRVMLDRLLREGAKPSPDVISV